MISNMNNSSHSHSSMMNLPLSPMLILNPLAQVNCCSLTDSQVIYKNQLNMGLHTANWSIRAIHKHNISLGKVTDDMNKVC